MSPRRSVFLVSFWVVLVGTYLLAVRQAKQVQTPRQQVFGRYSEHDVMERATPIIQALLPNQSGIFLTAYPGETMMSSGNMQQVWNIDCADSKGNDLVHIVCDANSGRICWLGYAAGSKMGRVDLTPLLPIALSSQMAAASAQRWMRTLGFRDVWQMQGTPQHQYKNLTVSGVRWLITLERPGWRAHLSLDVRTGTLMYANILPTH